MSPESSEWEARLGKHFRQVGPSNGGGEEGQGPKHHAPPHNGYLWLLQALLRVLELLLVPVEPHLV